MDELAPVLGLIAFFLAALIEGAFVYHVGLGQILGYDLKHVLDVNLVHIQEVYQVNNFNRYVSLIQLLRDLDSGPSNRINLILSQWLVSFG